MSHTEYECTILNIDIKEFVSKLICLGAEDKGEKLQKRYTYDFNPKDENRWIRLRTNGETTTVAIKCVTDVNAIGGNQELETEVGDFETMNEVLESLGYKHRNYQENKRWSFKLNGVSIEIDSWPLIPTYVEVEGSSEEEVLKTLEILGVDKSNVTTLDVTSIYNVIYGIDVLAIKDLRFNESMLEPNQSL